MGRAFKEQIIWLSRAWDGWSEAEQVVALYSVARKLGPIPTRFLQVLLTYNYPMEGPDIVNMEARANDPAWVSRICEAEDGGASDLLQHLPLLRPTNGEAKQHYLNVIPKVLSQVLSQNSGHSNSLEKARQLLSYALIHPAITPEERRSLGTWLRALEDKLSLIGFDSSPDVTLSCDDREEKKQISDQSGLTSSDNDFSKPCWNGSPIGQSVQQNKEDSRWNHLEIPASPNNSATSSRSSESESFTEEAPQGSPHPGMRDIGVWLKSLRLHKYYGLLCSYRYEEFLALDEDTLEAKGVTKGARHKIILSVAKLKERPMMLESIEKEITSGGSILAALNQLRQMSITPMLPSKSLDAKSPEGPSIPEVPCSTEEPDLPSQFTRVMGKVCTQLLVSSRPSDEAMTVFLHVVDRCCHHESFTEAQIKRLTSWKQQILRTWHPLPPRGKDAKHPRRWSHQFPGESFNRHGRFQHRFCSPNPSHLAGLLTAAALGGNSPHQTHLIPPPNPFFGVHGSMGPMMGHRNVPSGMTLGANSLIPPQHLMSKRPSLQETPSLLRAHVTLQRTRSAPSRPHQYPPHSHPPRSPVSPGGGTHPPSPAVHGQGLSAESYSPWISGDPNLNKGALLSVSPSDQPPGDVQASECDLTNRLESLCLSMTEHALE